jgi:hypothetical protein
MQHARGCCPLKGELFSLFSVATADIASRLVIIGFYFLYKIVFQIPYRMQRIIAQVSNLAAFTPRNQRRQHGNQRRQGWRLGATGCRFYRRRHVPCQHAGVGAGGKAHSCNGRQQRRPSGDMPVLAQAAGDTCRLPRRAVTQWWSLLTIF